MILSQTQSGFRKGHSTETAVTSVTNISAVLQCLLMYLKLLTLNHGLLLQSLQHIGFSNTVFKWFSNYLTERTQCVSVDKHKSASLEKSPQGSFLGPVLFTIYINNLGLGRDQAKVHLYADDDIIYMHASMSL